MIFEESFGLIKKAYPGAIDGLAVEVVKTGQYLTAARKICIINGNGTQT